MAFKLISALLIIAVALSPMAYAQTVNTPLSTEESSKLQRQIQSQQDAFDKKQQTERRQREATARADQRRQDSQNTLNDNQRSPYSNYNYIRR